MTTSPSRIGFLTFTMRDGEIGADYEGPEHPVAVVLVFDEGVSPPARPALSLLACPECGPRGELTRDIATGEIACVCGWRKAANDG